MYEIYVTVHTPWTSKAKASKSDGNCADTTMRTPNTVDQENDVKLMSLPSLTVTENSAQDTTKTTQSVVSNKSPKVSPSGLNDKSLTAKINQTHKSTDQTNGSVS